MPAYDAIIIGTGGVGSSAAFHLARRGARVLGLDRFPGGHDRGSSHGQSRVIRMAYFEHPHYVPLLRRAYALWFELEERTGEKLFHQVGLLEVGPEDGIVVPGVLRSKREYDLPVDELTPEEVARRFPGFHMPEGCRAVFEQNAGYLLVEQCVLAHLAAAKKSGAEIRTGESVESWTIDGDGVAVKTDMATYHAARLIITAGAWAVQLLCDLNVPFRVLRKHLHWYAATTDDYRPERGAATFFFELPDRGGFFYGFPQLDDRGIKIAEHSGGEAVDDPLAVDRTVDPQDRGRVQSFLRKHMPGVSLQPTDHAVCMYTMTADEHFIIDRHPQHEQVAFAAGLSGHGFKFTTVLGEALADLTLEERSKQPIAFLGCQRKSLTAPQ